MKTPGTPILLPVIEFICKTFCNADRHAEINIATITASASATDNSCYIQTWSTHKPKLEENKIVLYVEFQSECIIALYICAQSNNYLFIFHFYILKVTTYTINCVKT